MRINLIKTLLVYFFLCSFTANSQTIEFIKTLSLTGLDWGMAVDTTSDGGFVVCGGTYEQVSGWGNALLVKFNSNGDTVWKTIYGDGYWQRIYYVQQTSDKGFVATGNSWKDDSMSGQQTDVLVIKFDSVGSIMWANTYGGTNWESSTSIKQTSDSGFIICGRTESYGPNPTPGVPNIYLLRLNSNGDTLWSKGIGTSLWDEGMEVLNSTDGGFVIGGVTVNSTDATRDFYLVKTNSAGDVVWEKNYNLGTWEEARHLLSTFDGGYLISGFSNAVDDGNGFATNSDLFIIKTDSTGDTLWSKTYSGPTTELIYVSKQTSDGGYIIGGEVGNPTESGSAGYIFKLDSMGNTLWSDYISDGEQARINDLQITASGNYIVTGSSFNPGAGSSRLLFALVKNDSVTTGIIDGKRDIYPNSWSIFPNPASNFISIPIDSENPKLEIYNNRGNLILTKKMESSTPINIDNFTNGIYCIKLIYQNRVIISKLIILKK